MPSVYFHVDESGTAHPYSDVDSALIEAGLVAGAPSVRLQNVQVDGHRLRFEVRACLTERGCMCTPALLSLVHKLYYCSPPTQPDSLDVKLCSSPSTISLARSPSLHCSSTPLRSLELERSEMPPLHGK
jgi:hypothetical protein